MKVKKVLLISFAIAVAGLLGFWLISRSGRMSKHSYAKGLLQAVFHIQKERWVKTKSYSLKLEDFDTLESEAPLVLGYRSPCGQTGESLLYKPIGQIPPAELGEALLLVSQLLKDQCQPESDGFIAFAAKNLDADLLFDVWVINQKGDLRILSNDLN